MRKRRMRLSPRSNRDSMTIRHSSGSTSSGRSHNTYNRRPAMFEASQSTYLVPFDGTFRVADASTTPQTNGTPHKGKHRRGRMEELNKLQRVLAAGDKHA